MSTLRITVSEGGTASTVPTYALGHRCPQCGSADISGQEDRPATAVMGGEWHWECWSCGHLWRGAQVCGYRG